VQAQAPARLIEGGIPTEAMIAQVLVSKYADHLPLYRQAQIYARQGVNLDRSTLADWVGRAAFLLRPVHERLFFWLKRSGKLFADETTAPVLDPGRGRTKTGQLWAYLWTAPAPQGSSHLSGKSSVQLSIRPYGASPRALMRSADRRPITLASTKLDRSNGLGRPRSDRLPSLCRMPSQTIRVPILRRNPVFLAA
jgi:hypothetical protein